MALPPPNVITKSMSVTTSAAITAVLTNDGATLWYVTGFEITAHGATAGGIVDATLAGISGGTATYKIAIPTGVTAAGTTFQANFANPLAAVDVNTNVVLTLAATGSGSTGAAVVLHGYKGQRQAY